MSTVPEDGNPGSGTASPQLSSGSPVSASSA